MIKLFKKLIRFIISIPRRLRLAKYYVQLQRAHKQNLRKRKTLRSDVNAFLYEFFGIDAKSKFIPKKYKNSSEVKVAVVDKFGSRMDNLNVKFEDLFL